MILEEHRWIHEYVESKTLNIMVISCILRTLDCGMELELKFEETCEQEIVAVHVRWWWSRAAEVPPPPRVQEPHQLTHMTLRRTDATRFAENVSRRAIAVIL